MDLWTKIQSCGTTS